MHVYVSTCMRIIPNRYMCIHVHVTPNFLEFDATLAWTAIYLPGLFRTCHLPRIEGIGKWVKNLGCITPARTELWIIYACRDVLTFLARVIFLWIHFNFFFLKLIRVKKMARYCFEWCIEVFCIYKKWKKFKNLF